MSSVRCRFCDGERQSMFRRRAISLQVPDHGGAVVVPALVRSYAEADKLIILLHGLLAQSPRAPIVLVNDGSSTHVWPTDRIPHDVILVVHHLFNAGPATARIRACRWWRNT